MDHKCSAFLQSPACCAGLWHSCAEQIDVQTQTVIHWPTELPKTKELQTNQITDDIFPHCRPLSFAETQKHTYLQTLRHRHHCPDLMYWNVHFTSTERTQDNISLKRQISLQIKIPSSMSGHIQRMTDHKGRELQDTQANTAQPTILLFIIIQRAKWLINWFMCFSTTMLFPENTTFQIGKPELHLFSCVTTNSALKRLTEKFVVVCL